MAKKMTNVEYTRAREDLALIIAQETCGFVGAIPEGDDYDLADEFVKQINSDERP